MFAKVYWKEPEEQKRHCIHKAAIELKKVQNNCTIVLTKLPIYLHNTPSRYEKVSFYLNL